MDMHPVAILMNIGSLLYVQISSVINVDGTPGWSGRNPIKVANVTDHYYTFRWSGESNFSTNRLSFP